MKTSITLFVTVLAAALFGDGCASVETGGDPLNKLGLVAYYPFNGNAKDASGNGNDGKVFGASVTTNQHGASSAAIQFDGEDDHIQATVLPPMASVSISFWINSETAETEQYIMMDGDGNSGRDLYLSIQSDRTILFTTKDEDRWFSKVTVPVGSWVHVACIADIHRHEKSIWINGVKMGISKDWQSSNDWGSHYNLSIGSFDDGLHGVREFLKGKLDELRIYNRALSAEEVTALYESEKPKSK